MGTGQRRAQSFGAKQSMWVQLCATKGCTRGRPPPDVVVRRMQVIKEFPEMSLLLVPFSTIAVGTPQRYGSDPRQQQILTKKFCHRFRRTQSTLNHTARLRLLRQRS